METPEDSIRNGTVSSLVAASPRIMDKKPGFMGSAGPSSAHHNKRSKREVHHARREFARQKPDHRDPARRRSIPSVNQESIQSGNINWSPEPHLQMITYLEAQRRLALHQKERYHGPNVEDRNISWKEEETTPSIHTSKHHPLPGSHCLPQRSEEHQTPAGSSCYRYVTTKRCPANR